MLTEPAIRDALQTAIEEALYRRSGMPRRIAKLRRRRSPYESSFHLEELDVGFADGGSLRLMFKDLGQHALSRDGLIAKSDSPYDPLRELLAYERILSPAGLGPAIHGSVVEASHSRYWLFIEKVRGVELYQVGDFEAWLESARWLARMHSRFMGREARLVASAPLLTYNSAGMEETLRRLDGSPSEGVRALADSLAPRYSDLLHEVFAWPQTFVHGDFHASNVMIRAGTRLDVVPVDWERAGLGPGLLDLAALVSGEWDSHQRAAMATAYHGVLDREYGFLPPPAAVRRALEFARLLLALQWLAAPPEWEPPKEHARDWLAEARETARSLGLTRRPT